MSEFIGQRPYGLFIGGFDPSAGAGVLSDIKTAEQCGVYGFGVVSAITFQTEDCYLGQRWVGQEEMKRQIAPLLERYPVSYLKIGLIESIEVLESLVVWVRELRPGIKIVVDPVLAASAGYCFHTQWSREEFLRLGALVDVLTPNRVEFEILWPGAEIAELREQKIKAAVVIKGGHGSGTEVCDLVVDCGTVKKLMSPRVGPGASGKHGSGCVFAAALVSRLALGSDLEGAVRFAGEYVRRLMGTSATRLGVHFGNGGVV